MFTRMWHPVGECPRCRYVKESTMRKMFVAFGVLGIVALGFAAEALGCKSWGGGGGYGSGGCCGNSSAYGGSRYGYSSYAGWSGGYDGGSYAYYGDMGPTYAYYGDFGPTYAGDLMPAYNYSSQQSMPTDNYRSYYYDPAMQQVGKFTVILPDRDGQVWFDDVSTQQTGAERYFYTAPLDKEAAYTIKARWMDNGKPVDRQRTIKVRAGQTQTIDFRSEPADGLPSPKTSKQAEDFGAFQVANLQALAQGVGQQTPVKIDGDWTPVYVEIEGKKIDNKDFTHVTIKNNVVSCRYDGKVNTYRLEFGPHHMVRCTEGDKTNTTTTKDKQDAHTHYGVYIASQDFFCISLDKGMDKRFDALPGTGNNTKDRDNQLKAQGRWEGQSGPHGSAMVFVLRRSGTVGAEPR